MVDRPQSHANSADSESTASEPLGVKYPLQSAQPLSINQKFLVPLGARSLSVLDPSFFQSNLIQADFLDNPFLDSPFFDAEDSGSSSLLAESHPNTAAWQPQHSEPKPFESTEHLQLPTIRQHLATDSLQPQQLSLDSPSEFTSPELQNPQSQAIPTLQSKQASTAFAPETVTSEKPQHQTEDIQQKTSSENGQDQQTDSLEKQYSVSEQAQFQLSFTDSVSEPSSFNHQTVLTDMNESSKGLSESDSSNQQPSYLQWAVEFESNQGSSLASNGTQENRFDGVVTSSSPVLQAQSIEHQLGDEEHPDKERSPNDFEPLAYSEVQAESVQLLAVEPSSTEARSNLQHTNRIQSQPMADSGSSQINQQNQVSHQHQDKADVVVQPELQSDTSQPANLTTATDSNPSAQIHVQTQPQLSASSHSNSSISTSSQLPFQVSDAQRASISSHAQIIPAVPLASDSQTTSHANTSANLEQEQSVLSQEDVQIQPQMNSDANSVQTSSQVNTSAQVDANFQYTKDISELNAPIQPKINQINSDNQAIQGLSQSENQIQSQAISEKTTQDLSRSSLLTNSSLSSDIQNDQDFSQTNSQTQINPNLQNVQDLNKIDAQDQTYSIGYNHPSISSPNIHIQTQNSLDIQAVPQSKFSTDSLLSSDAQDIPTLEDQIQPQIEPTDSIQSISELENRSQFQSIPDAEDRTTQFDTHVQRQVNPNIQNPQVKTGSETRVHPPASSTTSPGSSDNSLDRSSSIESVTAFDVLSHNFESQANPSDKVQAQFNSDPLLVQDLENSHHQVDNQFQSSSKTIVSPEFELGDSSALNPAAAVQSELPLSVQAQPNIQTHSESEFRVNENLSSNPTLQEPTHYSDAALSNAIAQRDVSIRVGSNAQVAAQSTRELVDSPSVTQSPIERLLTDTLNIDAESSRRSRPQVNFETDTNFDQHSDVSIIQAQHDIAAVNSNTLINVQTDLEMDQFITLSSSASSDLQVKSQTPDDDAQLTISSTSPQARNLSVQPTQLDSKVAREPQNQVNDQGDESTQALEITSSQEIEQEHQEIQFQPDIRAVVQPQLENITLPISNPSKIANSESSIYSQAQPQSELAIDSNSQTSELSQSHIASHSLSPELSSIRVQREPQPETTSGNPASQTAPHSLTTSLNIRPDAESQLKPTLRSQPQAKVDPAGIEEFVHPQHQRDIQLQLSSHQTVGSSAFQDENLFSSNPDAPIDSNLTSQIQAQVVSESVIHPDARVTISSRLSSQAPLSSPSHSQTQISSDESTEGGFSGLSIQPESTIHSQSESGITDPLHQGHEQTFGNVETEVRSDFSKGSPVELERFESTIVQPQPESTSDPGTDLSPELSMSHSLQIGRDHHQLQPHLSDRPVTSSASEINAQADGRIQATPSGHIEIGSDAGRDLQAQFEPPVSQPPSASLDVQTGTIQAEHTTDITQRTSSNSEEQQNTSSRHSPQPDSDVRQPEFRLSEFGSLETNHPTRSHRSYNSTVESADAIIQRSQRSTPTDEIAQLSEARNAQPTDIQPEIESLPQVWQDLTVLRPLIQRTTRHQPALTSQSNSYYQNIQSINKASSETSKKIQRSSIVAQDFDQLTTSDHIPDQWSSLADLVEQTTLSSPRSSSLLTSIPSSTSSNKKSDKHKTETSASFHQTPEFSSVVQAQFIETPPIRVARHQPPTPVIARQEEDLATEALDHIDYLEEVAQAIYQRLRQRIRVEQERHGRDYFGRLPW